MNRGFPLLLLGVIFLLPVLLLVACAPPTPTHTEPTEAPEPTPSPTVPVPSVTDELIEQNARDLCLDAYDMPALSFQFDSGHEVSYPDTLSAYETDFKADLGSLFPLLGIEGLNIASLKNIVYVFNSIEKAEKEYDALLSRCTRTACSYGEECFVDTSKVPWTAVIRTRNVVSIVRTDWEDKDSLEQVLSIINFKIR